MSRRIEHVICEDQGRTAHCLRCDKKFTLELPAPLAVWAAAMKEFCKIHAHCKQRKNEGRD